MSTLALTPRQPVPALSVPLVGGGRHVLGATPAATFDLVVFYRGLHCPICAKYLMELERLAPQLSELAGLVLAGQKIPDHKPPKILMDKKIKQLGSGSSF